MFFPFSFLSFLTTLFLVVLKFHVVKNVKNKSCFLNTFGVSPIVTKLFPKYIDKSINRKVPITCKKSKIITFLNNNIYEDAYDRIMNKLDLLIKESYDITDHINTFKGFLRKYLYEIKKHKSCSSQDFLNNFLIYIDTFKKYQNYEFPNIHRYDQTLYEWSLKFWSELIDKKNSKFLGISNIKKIEEWRDKGHNIIIFSNHHIEADANIIKYFFHIQDSEQISRNIIFIGGHKIRVDPLSRPFSVTANLLCIYSKKYIENPPHLKEEKTLFNHKSLNVLRNLLNKGKQIIWLAPSGGRDRKGADGKIHISPFDPKIIQTFNVFAKRSKVKTHFIGLALNTYNICPPPNTIDVDEIEKERTCNYSPVYLNLGQDIFDLYPNMDEGQITTYLYNYVNQLYKQIS